MYICLMLFEIKRQYSIILNKHKKSIVSVYLYPNFIQLHQAGITKACHILYVQVHDEICIRQFAGRREKRREFECGALNL